MSSPIVSILTNALDESAEFYKQVLGFSENCRIVHPGVTLLFLQYEQFTLELVQRQTPAPPPGKSVVLTFVTDSFAPISARCAAQGIALAEPETLPSGVQMLRLADPNGVPISFVIEAEKR